MLTKLQINREQTWPQARRQLDDQIWDQVYGKVLVQVYDQVVVQVYDQIYFSPQQKAPGALTRLEYRLQDQQSWEEISNQVLEETWNRASDEVLEPVYRQVYGLVLDQVYAALWREAF